MAQLKRLLVGVLACERLDRSKGPTREISELETLPLRLAARMHQKSQTEGGSLGRMHHVQDLYVACLPLCRPRCTSQQPLHIPTTAAIPTTVTGPRAATYHHLEGVHIQADACIRAVWLVAAVHHRRIPVSQSTQSKRTTRPTMSCLLPQHIASCPICCLVVAQSRLEL